jgi:hypothetical protein
MNSVVANSLDSVEYDYDSDHSVTTVVKHRIVIEFETGPDCGFEIFRSIGELRHLTVSALTNPVVVHTTRHTTIHTNKFRIILE